jgi:hypothetical protein
VYPGATTQRIILPGELILIIILDAVTDPLSLTVVDEKCLSVSVTIVDSVVISDLVTLAVALAFAFVDAIDDERVRFDYDICDSVGVDELVFVCDAVTVPISFGVELSTAIVIRERESLHFDVSIALNVRVRFGVSEPE